MSEPSAGSTWLTRTGAWSALTIGAAYLAIIALYASAGAPPSVGDGEIWLRYLSGKTTIWWWILGLSVLTDVLFLPVALALYTALRGIQRDAMLMAVALIALFVVLDLACTWSHYASLLSLSRTSDAATTDVQRAALVAAATYAAAFLTSPLLAVYAIVTLSSGILIGSIVMLKGIFGRTTAYLGVATGILGVLALTGSGVAVILNAILATAWILLVGVRLHRLVPARA